MNAEIQANIQQIGDCLKTYQTWGFNNIVNICNDTVMQVPWGIDGYILFFFWIFLILVGVVFVIDVLIYVSKELSN